MAVSDLIPSADLTFAALLEHFSENIAQYIVTFGLTPAQITIQANDAVVYRFIVTQQARLIAAGQQATDAKTKLRFGNAAAPNTVISLAFPSQPSIVPSPVTPGIEGRFRKLIADIKGHANYTTAIGEMLKIEADEIAGPDVLNGQPDLTGPRVAGGHIIIPWKKGKFQGIRVEKDRGDGTGWHFVAVDTAPDYIDTEPHPAIPTIWKYRAHYIVDDQIVGQVSAVVEVRVGG